MLQMEEAISNTPVVDSAKVDEIKQAMSEGASSCKHRKGRRRPHRASARCYPPSRPARPDAAMAIDPGFAQRLAS